MDYARSSFTKRFVAGMAVTAIAVSALAGCSAPNEPVKPSVKLTSWADNYYGTFKPVTITGTGSKSVKVPAKVESALITFTNSSDAAFSVTPVSQAELDWLKDSADAQAGETIIPTIGGAIDGSGATSASNLWGIDTADQAQAVRFRIAAEGDWTMKITPISSLPALGDGGTGSGMFLYGGDTAGVTFAHEGDEPFHVTEYSSGLTLHLVDVSEKTPKAVHINAGPTVIEVGADGAWTAERTN